MPLTSTGREIRAEVQRLADGLTRAEVEERMRRQVQMKADLHAEGRHLDALLADMRACEWQRVARFLEFRVDLDAYDPAEHHHMGRRYLSRLFTGRRR